ncbi:hypothetical protein [Kitasatospora albolonga]|uniref:hypothetical protein n=1 Tax=Kitasatospora albolonga TaxID=68173 RepID=UPI0031EBA8D0
MRRTPAVLLAAALTVSLAACGSSATSGDAKPAAEGSKAADAAVFPRSVKHAMGTAEIKTQPKKVVVLDSGELDDVVLLGITPVGAVART